MMISIIIPVYNAARYLRACIDSILSQSFNDYELILVNDGSTDESLSILSEYEKTYSAIKLIDGPNEGVSKARNKGLARASGDWIAFVDADDYLLPGALTTLSQRALTTNADVVLANAMKLKDGQMSLLHSWPDEVLPCDVTSIRHFALWGYLFRADVIRENKVRFIDGLAYSEDRLFIYQLIPCCREIAYCREAVYVYRLNTTSACASRDTLRKVLHQFRAAQCLREIAQSYSAEDGKTCRILNHDCDRLINQGIYSFVEYPSEKGAFAAIKNAYKSMFGWEIKSRARFYAAYAMAIARHKKRTLMTKKKEK